MSHEIDSMMYVGEKPWHKLGKELGKIATAAEALAASGLDWTVSKRPVFLEGGVKIEDHLAVVRDDTNAPLGIVGHMYKPLQNKEAFSFFDAVVGEKAAIYHTAGSLRGGQLTWILAKLPGSIRVVKDDLVDKFLLLTNAHNGLRAARMMFTPIRVVCANTLNMSMSLKNSEMAQARKDGEEVLGNAWIPHFGDIGAKVAEVRNSMGIISAQYTMFAEAAKRLAATQLTRDAWKKYTENIGIRPRGLKDTELAPVTRGLLEKVSFLFEKGKGNDMAGVKGTAWAAYNGVVEYVDYRATKDQDARSRSILFGSGAALKQKAWDQALLIAKK
jgi:phage/plasmid-like protein (TIGR03299 family)